MNSFVKIVGNVFGLSAGACVLLVLAGCGTLDSGQPAVPAAPAAQIGGSPDAAGGSEGNGNGTGALAGSSDLLRAGDVVIITFSGALQPPARIDDRISQDGKITLPYLPEPIQAAGKTRSELQETIRQHYVPRLYKQLTVTVNADTRYFYVYGEVKKEGNYPYLAQMTVTKAIAAAGGFTDFARTTKVQLRRGKNQPVTVNCEKARRNPELDLPVYPDDTIYVPRRVFFN